MPAPAESDRMLTVEQEDPHAERTRIAYRDAVRMWRGRAHCAFDPLWQSGAIGRQQAYFWLAFQLGLDWHPHIGRLSTSACQRVVRVMRLAKKAGYAESVAMWRRGEKLVDMSPPTEVEL